MVVLEVGVHDTAIAMVYLSRLVQGHADAHTTPPISWLCEVFAFMILPQPVTSTARVTRTVPKSGSTFTSMNCAPWANVAY